ncbi:hypothetical protein B0O99DRAFT_596145 [Bisporella sp. PMI_857]|nr:hypothetical protein B0O99DRAFT_596145 [Bisporella sp. PMI_857]
MGEKSSSAFAATERYTWGHPGRYYKPFATRLPVLFTLLFLTLVLIGLLEYACYVIPAHAGVGGTLDEFLNSTVDIKIGNGARRRQVAEVITSIEPIQSFTPTPTPLIPSSTVPTVSTSDNKAPETGAPKGGYLCLGDVPTEDCTPQVPRPPPPASGYLCLGDDPSPDCVSSAPVPAVPVPTVPQNANVKEPANNPAVPTNPANFPTDVGPGNLASAPAGVAPQSGYLSQTGPAGGHAPLHTADVYFIGGETTTLPPGQRPSPVTFTSNGKVFVQSPSSISHSQVLGAPPTGGYLETEPTATSTSARRPSATIVNSTGTYYQYADGTSALAPQITRSQYIMVSFIPLVVAVLFMIPFRIVDSTIREMEPFHQLHKEAGALAEYSICLDYTTSLMITTPFKSLCRGHFFVFWSSLISVTILALTPLSSEALFVSLSGKCGPNMAPCRAVWGIYPLLARIIEGMLAFIAILLVLMIIFQFFRKSGVYSEPLSIAGHAVLLANSPLLSSLGDIDSRASNKQLKEILAGKRYKLGDFTSYDGRQSYGIIPADPDMEAGFASVVNLGKRKQYHLVHNPNISLSLSPPLSPPAYHKIPHTHAIDDKPTLLHQIKAKFLPILVFVLSAGLFVLITYYHFSKIETGFDHFMSSMGFGVRFMMAALGVLLNLMWSSIDQDLRRSEPLQRLLRGDAAADEALLVPVSASAFSAFFASLYRRDWLLALVALSTVLSEFLPIFLANISFSPAMTKKAYTYCTYISMSFLGVMILCILVLVFRRGVGKLPRDPDTVAGVGMYLAGGGFMEGFERLSELGTKERNEVIREREGRYTLGVLEGGRLGIDEDWRVMRERHF